MRQETPGGVLWVAGEGTVRHDPDGHRTALHDPRGYSVDPDGTIVVGGAQAAAIRSAGIGDGETVEIEPGHHVRWRVANRAERRARASNKGRR